MKQEIKQRIEQIQRGEVPQGYKKTKVGVVPKEWDTAHFSKMFSRLTRKNIENNTNVLTISAQYGLINQEDFFNKSVASDDKSNYYLLCKGDFAYNKSYSNGYPYGAIKELEFYDKGVVSPLYICFSKTEKNECTEFYSQYFESGMMNREIKAFAQEGARNHGLLNIAVGDFFNAFVIVPPTEEQNKIAEILTKQDKLIEIREKLIEQKQKQKKYLMQQLLTGNQRLPGFTDEWEKVKIKEIGDIVTGSTPSRKKYEYWDGIFPWVTAQDFVGKYIYNSIEKISTLGKKACRIIPKNSILITCIASIGLNAITKVECATNQQINAIICNKKYNNELIYYMIKNIDSLLKKIAGKTAVPIISKTVFSNITLRIPVQIDEQNAISEILSKADEEIELLQKELEQEKLKKKSLMQLLLSGIVRVNIE